MAEREDVEARQREREEDPEDDGRRSLVPAGGHRKDRERQREDEVVLPRRGRDQEREGQRIGRVAERRGLDRGGRAGDGEALGPRAGLARAGEGADEEPE